jgi:hypothetical protein
MNLFTCSGGEIGKQDLFSRDASRKSKMTITDLIYRIYLYSGTASNDPSNQNSYRNNILQLQSQSNHTSGRHFLSLHSPRLKLNSFFSPYCYFRAFVVAASLTSVPTQRRHFTTFKHHSDSLKHHFSSTNSILDHAVNSPSFLSTSFLSRFFYCVRFTALDSCPFFRYLAQYVLYYSPN